MSDIAVLAHLAPVLGAAPSGPTVRRALDLAGTPAMLDRIARARARARAHVWTLIEGTPTGFPWLAIAGKTLTGWLVIDLDATLVTARSDKEGAAPTWKKGYDLLTEPHRVRHPGDSLRSTHPRRHRIAALGSLTGRPARHLRAARADDGLEPSLTCKICGVEPAGLLLGRTTMARATYTIPRTALRGA